MEGFLQKDCVKKLVFVLTIVVTMVFTAGVLIAADLKDVKKKGVLRHLGIPYANFVTGAGGWYGH